MYLLSWLFSCIGIRAHPSKLLIFTFFIGSAIFPIQLVAQPASGVFAGTVLDPASRTVAGASVEIESNSGERSAATSGSDGGFRIPLSSWGSYMVRVEAPGFVPLNRKLELSAASTNVQLRLEQVNAASEKVIVNADVSAIALAFPDPSEKVLVREELLDANPGRPGAPISIPGLPI